MSEAKAPSFLHARRRPQAVANPPGEGPVPVHETPEVKNFLSSYVSTTQRLYELERALGDAELEIDKQVGRTNYLSGELQRSNLKKVEFQEGYVELRAQLSLIASTAVASLKAQQEATIANLQSVINVIEQALRGAQERMRRANISEDEINPAARTTEPLEDGIKRIAEQFGANSRRPETDQEVE